MSDAFSYVQENGVPFDMFIQSLTEQLDKAQAAMALKARVGKLPMTFAVKDVSIDLRAFVQIVNDEVFVRPANPGEREASSITLALTTITKPMIEENAIDFKPEDPKISLRNALGDSEESEDMQRKLERIGVRNVNQLMELRKTAGADVIARLARLPVNRLQQALMQAAAPRVDQIQRDDTPEQSTVPSRLQMRSPLLRRGALPRVMAAGHEVPVLAIEDGAITLAPLASQMGCEAEIDLGEGEHARVRLQDGSIGEMMQQRPRINGGGK